METFDSPGRVLPVGTTDQNIVSKKITDKDGQGQSSRHQQQKSAGSLHPEDKDEDTNTAKHVIDIIV
jgi:hypothetical protein